MPLFNALILSNLYKYCQKLDSLYYISVADSSFNHFEYFDYLQYVTILFILTPTTMPYLIATS